MPFYDYACQLGHDTEVFHSYDEDLPRDDKGELYILCPICDKHANRKYFAKTVIYNASGFYGCIPTDLAHNTGQV